MDDFVNHWIAWHVDYHQPAAAIDGTLMIVLLKATH